MKRIWQAVWREPRVVVGAGLLLTILAMALFAHQLAPHDPNDQDLLNTLLPPFWVHGASPTYPLGTDNLGRCVLSRLIYGARVAVIVGTAVPIGTALLGAPIALIAGYRGKTIDWLANRVVDVWMSFPSVVLSLILIVALSPSLRNVILAMVLVHWTRFFRVIRSEILGLMKLDYIAAARIAGASHLQVVLRDVLPGVFPMMVTLLSVEVGLAVVIESVLSFVGKSVEPDVPTWGTMIADGLLTAFQNPWGLVLPMVAIVATVIGANTLGDGLRVRLDPRQNQPASRA